MLPAVYWRPETQDRCVICLIEFPMSRLVHLSHCRHSWCSECLAIIFEESLIKEARFPPRCCKMPVLITNSVWQALSPDLIQRFFARQEELGTDVLERTYCHVPRCSTFIQRRDYFGSGAKCPKCRAMTCIVCKKKQHNIVICVRPLGVEVPGLPEIAWSEGWKQCPSCRQMIERDSGCSEIGQ